MLGPQDRRLLLDSLKPPDGYSLDFAVGTTYSLDLLALLTAPLAFTLFDWQDAEGRPNADPLATLEALRRYADRMAVFCQAGQILVPRHHRTLFGYLEESLFEVTPPGPTFNFHPKFWVLRFSSAGEPTRYRLLCLSRNLTFDRSWDTALVLDGEVVDRKHAFSENHPLGEFIEALPGMSTRPLPDETLGWLNTIAHELRRLKVELPEGFDAVSFWPLGLPARKSWPFKGRYSRLLVVSPFLADSLLDRLTQAAGESVLISRLESLEEANRETLAGFSNVYSLSPSADVEEAQAETTEDVEELQPLATHEATPFSGLHAKLYIAEHGWDASVFTGSANATSAAFGGNVEFLVELVGKRSRVGIDPLLKKPEGSVSFSDLLQPYIPSPEALEPDAVQRRLEELVEGTRRILSATCLEAAVSQLPGEDLFGVDLRPIAGSVPQLPPGAAVRCWPITLKESDAAPVTGGAQAIATFPRVSFAALTSFFAFEVLAEEDGRQACVRFAVNAALVGAPADRRERILRSLLSSPEQVLRFLMFLLSEFGTVGVSMESAADAFGGDGPFRWGASGVPLIESLLKALHQNPTKLDQVAKLVEDLRAGGQDLLPAGFDEVWQPVWEARQRVGA